MLVDSNSTFQPLFQVDPRSRTRASRVVTAVTTTPSVVMETDSSSLASVPLASAETGGPAMVIPSAVGLRVLGGHLWGGPRQMGAPKKKYIYILFL